MIVRKTLKDIENTITAEDIKKFKQAMKGKPDLTDPDALPPTEEMRKNCVRVGRPRQDIVRTIVALRLPSPLVSKLKATGKGWNTRASLYLEKGIMSGKL